MRNLFLALAAIVALVLTQGVAGASAIVNGGFETGDFSGWTLTGNLLDETITSGLAGGPFTLNTAYNGTYAAKLGQVGTLGYLSQNITTIPGDTYDVSFWLANDLSDVGVLLPNGHLPTETPNTFELQINNNASTWSLPNFSVAFPYQNVVASFIATTTTTNIKFGFRQDPAYWYLDNVEVNTVPEPATFTLIGVTLIGLAIIGRRRHHS